MKIIELRLFSVVCPNTHATLSGRSMILNVTLLNRNFTTAEILLRNKRMQYQIISMVKIMTRLISIRKSSNTTICTRFNVGNEIKDSSVRVMKLMKEVIKWK